MPTPFLNPWPLKKSDKSLRLVSDIPPDQHDFLMGISPSKGNKQIIVNIIVNKIINELKRRGITNCTHRDEFERFICECELIMSGDRIEVAQLDFDKLSTGNFIRRVPATELVSNPTPPALPGGTESNGAEITSNAGQHHDIQSVRGRSKRPGGKGKVAKGKRKGGKGD